MKKFLFFLLILFSVQSQAQDTLRALFLGNSYTNSNNLPNLIDQIANSLGDDLIHDKNTPGGHQLNQHYNNASSLNKIALGTWDYVVMQEQSQIPSLPPSYTNTLFFPYADSLNTKIKEANVCTETVFFMTWGRENGDASNCPGWTPSCTYEGMQGQLRMNYLQAAVNENATVSPVGVAWKKVRETISSV